MSLPEPPDVAGARLPGGRYRITREEAALFAEAVGAEADDRIAHPAFFFVATQGAMGVSVDELLAMCAFKAEDGPLLTNMRAELDAPLKVDADYEVAGEIVSLIRKPSRTFGTVDVLTFRLDLIDAARMRVARVTNTWMLPRRGEAGA
ncbi:MAG TPA: hypothetical protein PLN53_08560 [Terricaulis sp.]|nr:hypothetical protein [Terricaulis sp.]